MGRTPGELAFRLRETWPGDAARGAALLGGEFRFAGEVVRAERPPWNGDRRPEWRAELHRFGWLADIALVGSEAGWRAARQWTADWLDRCDAWDPVAWRADVLGDRLLAWLEHWEGLAGRDGAADFSRRLLASFARQCRHPGRTAHREGTGLGRLKALRGLVAAAAALGGRGRVDRALKSLERELAAQVLPDGGHASRSPAAQLAALRCLVDARTALAAAQLEVPVGLQQAIDRAAPMLRFFRHGDGRLALFNGAVEDEVARIDLVLARADARGRAPLSAPHTGFQRLQAGRTLVLMDCGRPAPAGFDDDAHAGTLAFELSHGRERIIVNCGAYHGPNRDWRQVTRATAAHSTLVVGDTNSAEITAEGTLGRRPEGVTCERAEEDGSQWVAASHDGYQAPFGLTHARQLFLAGGGDDLRGEDRLSGRAGQGFAIRFHLHPEVEASLTADANAVLLRGASGVAWRLRAQGAVISLAESIYAGSGEIRKAQQVVLDGHVGTAGATVKWAVRREARKAEADAARSDASSPD
jgi:uncharacterized heparinase superfamily protein